MHKIPELAAAADGWASLRSAIDSGADFVLLLMIIDVILGIYK